MSSDAKPADHTPTDAEAVDVVMNESETLPVALTTPPTAIPSLVCNVTVCF